MAAVEIKYFNQKAAFEVRPKPSCACLVVEPFYLTLLYHKTFLRQLDDLFIARSSTFEPLTGTKRLLYYYLYDIGTYN